MQNVLCLYFTLFTPFYTFYSFLNVQEFRQKPRHAALMDVWMLTPRTVPNGAGRPIPKDQCWRQQSSLSLFQVALYQALNAGQDDLVGAAALFWAVRRVDGQHPRHTQRPSRFSLLCHGDVVCFQPALQVVLPLVELLRAVRFAFLGGEYAGKPCLHFIVRFLQDVNLLDSVAQHNYNGRSSVLWEVCQDNTARERRTCDWLYLTEDRNTTQGARRWVLRNLIATQVFSKYQVVRVFLEKNMLCP